ncbi:kinase [Paenisporosarcina quisquiliarum]|uniref:Kinase n=1 Tax=Paenisporosarcina quisquiliarum TaxID=365346 RepID=A0A9X3RE76_9BACL|nr:kinase [Paenisporosarcina quisquiliarum]MCZ8537078.1 kinase [Paenisporosarcina quisquiliarum]
MEDCILSSLNEIPNVKEGQRFILGIDCLSRSGKTTFVKKFEQHFQEKDIPLCILHIDDYIVVRNQRYNTGREEWYEYYHLQWDTEWLKDHLFKKLKSSRELHLLTYDYSSDTQKSQVVRLPETCLIIIEGVFLQRKAWRSFYDYMIYLDCPREKRFNRESETTQMNIEKFRTRYWKAEDYYLKTEFPKKQADMVFQN